jgi:radical SAM superfamily enzyme YgiQ (UPF0313 family)
MIRFSVNIMRGCFGGCTFCSITEHEGRIIQNRSEDSIIREIEKMRDVPGFTGIVSDLAALRPICIVWPVNLPKLKRLAVNRPVCILIFAKT